MQAALFAGFLSAFLIELLSRLEPDPLDTIQDVLIYQTQMMRNASLGPYVPADFSPPEHIVVVNALFYASLGVMLLAAFIAMLIKSWVREFDRGLQAITIPEQRAKTREFRYLGMERWKLYWMVAALPMLIQISLLLFAIGLVLFLFYISKPSFGVTTAIFGIGVIYYAITTTISVFATSSPFHSPLSRIFGRLWQFVHAIICPTIDHFLSPNMETIPMFHVNVHRWIQISLQKFRPYSEKEFETPITATTVDECQLDTAASVLQRIHDNMPNSPHSQLIHQSVWRVAGSPALRIQPLFKLPSCILDRGHDEEYFSRLSLAGVVGLTSVFVRMRDARYKDRIAAVRHIHNNPSYTQEPMAELVNAIFDLLPDGRHSDVHPASINNALRRDALLHYALPDVPLLDTLRNTLLRNTLSNAPVHALHDIILPYDPDPNLAARDPATYDPVLPRVPRTVHSVIRAKDVTSDEAAANPVTTNYHRFTLFDCLMVGPMVGLIGGLIGGLVIFLIHFWSVSLAPALLIWTFLAGPIVVIITYNGPLPGLHRVLLYDDPFNDGDALHDAFRDAQPYAPFFIKLSPYLLRALVLVYVLFRNALDASLRDALCDALFREGPFRSSLRLLFRSNTRLDAMTTQGRITRAHLEPEEPKDLINILQKIQPLDEEAIWLLNTLSGLHCDGLVQLHVSKMCLTILWHQAPKWNRKTPPNIMLIEAVITLAAISRSSNETYQRETLTNSHRHPWLLLNLRNPKVISGMIENMNDSSQKELISLLFLVTYGLFLRGSEDLARQYLAIILAKCNFSLCASGLVVIAPALGDDLFVVVGGLLQEPQTRHLLKNYGLQLGASQFPDPESLAILLLLSRNLQRSVRWQLRYTGLKLKNPWLHLVASVIAQYNIPDESGMDFKGFHGHRVHNMIAALSLSRYSEGYLIHSTARESLLLASFLPSREFIISSLALSHYLETVISYSNPPPPSHYLSGAMQALFSPILPDNYLLNGWKILQMFVDGFEKLSTEWQQTFAEAFFTVSHRPLLSETGQNGAPVTELKDILTWEYFCKERQEPMFTDGVYSGLDWMALAWSLHLSQQSSMTTTALAQRAAQPPGLREPPENEEFVLRVLCRLLDAAPYYSVLPIIPKLHEFVAWFEDPELVEYQSMVSVSIARIEGAKQECERSYMFQKVNCMWYL